MRKCTSFKSGAAASGYVSPWQYFNLMAFIKDEIVPSKTTGNLDTGNETRNQPEENPDDPAPIHNDESSEDTEMIEAEQPSPAASNPSTDSRATEDSSCSISSKRKRNAASQREAMLVLENKKLQFMEARLKTSQELAELRNDEDYLYLMSILPSMRRLSPIQKLRFRGKINEWLIEETTRAEYPQPYGSQVGYFTEREEAGTSLVAAQPTYFDM